MGEQLRLADRLGGLFIVSDSGYGPNRHCITLVSQWHSLGAPDAPVGARVKFTPAQGAIVVRFEQVEENVVWSVSDTGEGIPDDNLEAVFDRFVQLTKNDRRGVGLGLFISKCIVQGHGGRIWVENRTGGGSTFCFSLPIDAD